MISKQSGVALITVMLILALATVTAVSMASRQNMDIHRSANILNYEQAYQYISGAEDFSKQMLIRYYAGGSLTVTEEKINSWVITFPIEGGTISGKIVDLQRCFNLNNLVDSAGVAIPLQMKQLRNLLANLTLKPNLVEAIVDWIDRDQNPYGLNGVEDNEYLVFDPPYTTANQPMSNISELLLIKGIDYTIYQTLLPHVCVLKEVNSKINVNTASAEVISSLDSKITLDQAKLHVAGRTKDGYSSVVDFLKDPMFSGLKIDTRGLSLNSDYFRLTAAVQIEKTNLMFISQLHRDAAGVIKVIKHSRSVL